MRQESKANTTIVQGADPKAVGPYLARALEDDAWLQAQVEVVAGGRSNLTYAVRAPDKEVILRRPPLGHVLPTAHDMWREYRVLSVLHGTDVPVPRTLHFCRDESVIGAPFYVMERLHGHILRGEFPPGYAESSEEKRRIGEALIDTLVRIHSVDFEAVGLTDFGHPDGFMARQLRRWRQQWERSVTRPLTTMDCLIAELEDRLPTSSPPTIVHGDYRVDNTVLDPKDPGRIIGVLDWEMSTLGDSLADMGLLLVYWAEEADSPEFRSALGGITVTSAPGFPTRAEVVERYAALTGRDMTDLPWYWAFGCFKLAVVLEGIHARFLQGKTVGDGFEGIGERVPSLVSLGFSILERNEIAAV